MTQITLHLTYKLNTSLVLKKRYFQALLCSQIIKKKRKKKTAWALCCHLHHLFERKITRLEQKVQEKKTCRAIESFYIFQTGYITSLRVKSEKEVREWRQRAWSSIISWNEIHFKSDMLHVIWLINHVLHAPEVFYVKKTDLKDTKDIHWGK